ncbi:hypothetical protein [Hamadaea tsunoensis]|uniref:hypothetical protein n=1 Tax=Hamadaea tsunoensis TaxID=53368 RepID=UPI000688E2EC|nr:hypothetical protein [Hamadaea tsunoensis]
MASRRAPIAVAALSVLLGVGLLGTAVYAKARPRSNTSAQAAGNGQASVKTSPSPTPPPPPPPPTLKETKQVSVSMAKGGFFAWALMNRKTGDITGSDNDEAAKNTTESMVKAWLVSDYLRRQAEAGKTPTQTALNYASTAIRDSNDNSAQWLYKQNGGNASIQRLIKTCRLADKPVIKSGWWSMTQITAADAVRMGDCIGDGTAAGPKWTAYVLNEMEHVRGTTAAKDQHAKTGGGHWGIIDGLPAVLQQGTSIKNGWTLIFADGLWHINCLAIHSDWVLAVQMRFPGKLGLAYGAGVCKSVAQQLVYQPTTAEG